DRVDGLNQIENLDSILCFVRLQVPDEMPARRAAHLRFLVARFLHAILSDVCDACGNRLVDLLRRKRLRNGDERNLTALAPGALAGGANSPLHRREILSDAHATSPHNVSRRDRRPDWRADRLLCCPRAECGES